MMRAPRGWPRAGAAPREGRRRRGEVERVDFGGVRAREGELGARFGDAVTERVCAREQRRRLGPVIRTDRADASERLDRALDLALRFIGFADRRQHIGAARGKLERLLCVRYGVAIAALLVRGLSQPSEGRDRERLELG